MNPNRLIWGTCQGTGAVINVCLGFIPKYVKLWNLEDAHSKWPTVEWINPDFLAIGAADEGVLDADDGSQLHRTLLNADGISPYSGGDELTYDGVTNTRWEDSAGDSAEEVYVNGHYSRDEGTDTAFQCIGTKVLGKTPSARDNGVKIKTTPGFKIGANGDINVNDEQLVWMVVG